MIVFPNCKINLGLNVLKKRADGYHDLESVFVPLPITDALEIIETRNHHRDPGFPFSSSGLPIPGKPASNLCVKAYRLLKKDFPEIPGVHIHLHKLIPTGAGMGGGSSDASFTLCLLNHLFGLSLTEDQLIAYAMELGSDCPFFIINKPCRATGRGEILEPLTLDLSAYTIVVVNPGIPIDTGQAFLDIIPSLPEKSLVEMISEIPENWHKGISNDFEKIIFPKYPEIKSIKERLLQQGALFASLSGTGSTVYGIFSKGKKIEFDFPPHYFLKILDGK